MRIHIERGKRLISYVVLVATLLFFNGTALAVEPTTGHPDFDLSSVTYTYVSVGTSYSTNVTSAKNTWNSVSLDIAPYAIGSKPQIVASSGGMGADIGITSDSYGNTGWDGITSGRCSTSNYHWYGQVDISLNSTYFIGETSAKRTGVVSHELGHYFGLADNRTATGRLMYYSTNGRTNNTPQTSDIISVQALSAKCISN